jgi:pyridine nucleotide-disulfide oxidoreductase family protein
MKHLVLLGGGHAHVHVLKTLSAQSLVNTKITLITPYCRQVYSGMLPGWIAGHYALDDCMIQLTPLARAVHIDVIESACREIDFAKQQVVLANGTRVAFDFLSIDTGSVANRANLATDQDAIAIRPIEDFIRAITTLKENVIARHRAGATSRIAVVGAGAGGVEVAFALQHGLHEYSASIMLISAVKLEAALPKPVASRLIRAITRAGITLHEGVAATQVARGAITLAHGEQVNVDAIILALGAKAATWPQQSGLACDGQGYILTNDYLQSISHPNVFAAGDCATMQNFPRPKSGVYAVRAGPPLTNNLQRAINGDALERYTPQARSLYLISTGDKYAIGSWGKFAWQGRWVWRWKDKIDRAFMAKYRA